MLSGVRVLRTMFPCARAVTVACFSFVVFRLSFLFESCRLIVLSFLLWEERASLAGELRTGGLNTGIKGRVR